jgi:hypothetical protein
VQVVFPEALGVDYGHVASPIHDDLDTAITSSDFLIFATFLSYIVCRDPGASAKHVRASICTLSETGIHACTGRRGAAGHHFVVGGVAACVSTVVSTLRRRRAGSVEVWPRTVDW